MSPPSDDHDLCAVVAVLSQRVWAEGRTRRAAECVGDRSGNLVREWVQGPPLVQLFIRREEEGQRD